MANTNQGNKVSELSYQGPLIGMRSTRTKSTPSDTNSKTGSTKQ